MPNTITTRTAGILALSITTFGLLIGCSSDGAPSSATTATAPTDVASATTTTAANPPASTTDTGASQGATGATGSSPNAAVDADDFLAQRGLIASQPPVQADVTGDGEPETLLNAQTPECASCHARTFFVLSGPDVLYESGGEGWLQPLSDGSGFEWISPLRIPGEGLCCPSWFAVETYRWTGATFERDDLTALKHFQEVNQLPVQGALEPPEQLATVVLFYTLLERKDFAHAYELFSSGMRAQTSLDSWSAGFSTTESVVVETVSTGASASEVKLRFTATDLMPNGDRVTTTFEGIWNLVEEDGAWRLDNAEITSSP